jgi:hypothetical protein
MFLCEVPASVISLKAATFQGFSKVPDLARTQRVNTTRILGDVQSRHWMIHLLSPVILLVLHLKRSDQGDATSLPRLRLNVQLSVHVF